MTTFEKRLDALENREYCLAQHVLLAHAGRTEYAACVTRALNQSREMLETLSCAGLVEYDARADVWRVADGVSEQNAVLATEECVQYAALRHLGDALTAPRRQHAAESKPRKD